MAWKLVTSGGKNYTIYISGRSHSVRRNDAFTWSGGTFLGSSESLSDALEIIKADSGAKDTRIRDG